MSDKKYSNELKPSGIDTINALSCEFASDLKGQNAGFPLEGEDSGLEMSSKDIGFCVEGDGDMGEGGLR